MLSRARLSRRSAIVRGLLVGVAAGSLPLAGCGGEKELPVIASSKSKDELQKDIENPYGAPVKKPGKGKRGGRSSR